MTPQVEGKAAQLKALGESLLTATESPLYAFRTENGYFPVIGEGYPAAKIMFIGQAPGKYEAEKGRPFVGPSGEILAEMLASIGLRREEVYVTNIVLDHPPKNRDPMPNEIAFYTPYLDQIIDIVQPLVIATLGSYAMNFILKKYNAEQYGTITQLHGKLIPVQVPYGEIHIVPLYHPAVVLYTASKKAVLMQDFQKLRVYV
jgi:DNA polymerase